MTNTAGADPGLTILLLFVGVFCYFVPTVIAAAGHKRNASAIGAVNLLLGWTLLGWVIALVWSLAADADTSAGRTARCAYCAELVRPEARVCRSCGREFVSRRAA